MERTQRQKAIAERNVDLFERGRAMRNARNEQRAILRFENPTATDLEIEQALDSHLVSECRRIQATRYTGPEAA